MFLKLFCQRLDRDCRRLDQIAQLGMESAYLSTTPESVNTVNTLKRTL